MATVNYNLVNLTDADIQEIGNKYLMGWHDLSEYGFRIKGFNKQRAIRNFPQLDKDVSFAFRIDYVQDHYSFEDIKEGIYSYMLNNRMDEARWTGIELFDCRFGRDYAKIFKELLGDVVYSELSELCRVKKSKETQLKLYGGVGLAGDVARNKALTTNMEVRGVKNPMFDPNVKSKLEKTNVEKYGGASPFSSKTIRDKASRTRLRNIQKEMESFRDGGIIDGSVFKNSKSEMIVFYELIKKFGKDDVYFQYGKHPYDKRYPYNCDFYIKSLDLFIEMNLYYSHGNHWFDSSNHDDCLRVKHLQQTDKRRNRVAVDTWVRVDVEKRNKAKSENIKYLVFWDSSTYSIKKERLPNLNDFYEWFDDYDCDYKSFVKDNPENTY